MSANSQVMEFFPKTLNRLESDAVVDSCERAIAERGWGVWAVKLIETNEFIGIAGLNIPSADLPTSPCVEVLWRLVPSQWGRGLATESASAALQVGFDQIGLKEIVAFVVPSNTKSRAVMERLNLSDTGETFEHPELPQSSHLRTHCVYTICRETWANKAGLGE